MRRTVLVPLMLVAVAGACARPYPPPGGEQDSTPPRLTGTTPEPLAVEADFRGPVVFRFDERLSERNFTESLALVSPLDGALRVDRGRQEVRVSIDGGWRPNRVYRVTLLPGIRDLFGNARTDAAELVFSTGPPVPSTAIAGIVQDRVSGLAAQNAVVTALRRADSVAYLAVGDSAGFFSLRHLPLGVYELRAFSDQNRNRRRDLAEPVDSGRVVSLTDTLVEVFSVLAPDSTPPRVTDAEAIDSIHIRVTIDDPLAPDTIFSGLRGEVLTPDSAVYSTLERIMHPTWWERQRSVPADTGAQRRPPPPQSPLLPTRQLIVRVLTPLTAGAEYIIRLTNIVNLSGATGGGTEKFQVRAAPVRPDTSAYSRPR